MSCTPKAVLCVDGIMAIQLLSTPLECQPKSVWLSVSQMVHLSFYGPATKSP